MTKLYFTILIIISLVCVPKANAGKFNVAETSAQIASTSAKLNDSRVVKLEKFLRLHKSPMAENADDFVYFADKFDLDWRLVASIAGVESTFGKRIPAGSFNAYGWAGGKHRFESWEKSIETVSKALREKYYNRGADTLTEINRIYCPPNPKWSSKVAFFMEKIDPHPVEFSI